MAGGTWTKLRKTLQRKRVFAPEQLETGNLRRCLSLWDLTGLGLGSTLGVGVYVLVGVVAMRYTGPSILLSFLIAAVASLFAGLCYAEFGSRVPRAGSVYIYTYVTIGEFVAFIIGWNVILEAVFGSASVAKGLSMYIDSMANGTMSDWFTSVAPVSSVHLSSYFDLFAFLIVICLGVLLAVGARESSMINNVFAVLNMAVIAFIIIAGSVAADPQNWFIPASEVPANAGNGGFFPFGVWGTLKGAAMCFYGFVGFDVINASGEEVQEPRRTIPQAILTVLLITFFVYAGVATVVTMMVPYYSLDKLAATATAFSYVGWDWARWVVTVGAIFGIMASLFGSLFPLPRLLYAMASDGLLAHWFARVSTKRKSPAIATLIPTCVIAILASILDLEQLILMMCVGTLLSYSIVAACVILLRYRSKSDPVLNSNYVKQMIGYGDSKPSRVTSRIVIVSLLLFICLCVTMALILVNLEKPLIAVSVLHGFAVVLVIIMMMQPQAKEELKFKTPMVPIIPCLSIYVNVHLMILLNVETWIRVLIWASIGIPIYILCIACYKRENNLEDNLKAYSKTNFNGKTPVKIIVEAPSPPATMNRSTYRGDETDNIEVENNKQQENVVTHAFKTDEILVEHAIIENNEEKEAKIIDLLDQVLQAEEDSYGEMISLKEHTEAVTETTAAEPSIPHRKSLSELSDAGSDASLGNQVLSKYDVIAQVHREDLPKVNEEEEKEKADEIENIEHEEVTPFNDSESNSRTDESGYSDTIDKNALNDSTEDTRDVPNIPPPPPFDESYFASPYFKKSYTISSRPIRQKSEEEINKPRESIKSNNSQDDNNIVFGSDRQMNFMSKLNNIFQNKISNEGEVMKEEQRRRSNSTGDVAEASEFVLNRDRPAIFLDLKKELAAVHSTPNLRPVNVEDKQEPELEQEDDEEDTSMSKEDLKSKLENIFAAGGPTRKPRLMKTNPPTPEESYQTDASSTESIAKLPKMEKNDTLKRQKDKFGAVLNSLNSFRLSKDERF